MRQLLRLCVPHRRVAAAVAGGLRRVAEMSSRMGISSVARVSLSGIYAIAYCQGVAVELGHPDALWALVGHHHGPAAA
jgi:hypothetical protein